MNLYESIEKSIREHVGVLHVSNDVQESNVRHAIRWVMRNNPDIFWFVHQYHFDKDNGIVSFRYRCSPERSAAIQKSIVDVVKYDFQIDYVRTIPQIEQVAYIYKWMLTYCNYNVNSAYNQSIDSVFVRRNSVCTGYAKAAQYLFYLLGIESRLVFGKLNNDKEDVRHCWNIVCVEGSHYQVDICLGDLSLEDILLRSGATTVKHYGDYNYNCFCVSTDEILKTRSIEDIDTLPLCDKNLHSNEVERLSGIEIKQRSGIAGCLMTHIGSSADIYLCAKDKNVVLKKFRSNNIQKCFEEYGYMFGLRGCKHLLHLNEKYSDVKNNILAVEQSTPIVDLFCSHYYHPTLNGVLRMITDITSGWIECRLNGILYRDIHLCNIYKANDGRYKIGDFGSCTYELRGLKERVGNPWFMSPETYISGQYDERSAVYSITAVLYFVLNGLRPPFADSNNEENALQRKMKGETLPVPLLLHSFPKDVADMIMRGLICNGCAYYPSDRIQTCMDLLSIIVNLSSTLNNQRIELYFVQQVKDFFLIKKTVSDVFLPRVIQHGFTYGEEVETMTISQSGSPYCEDVERNALTSFLNIDNDSCFEHKVNYSIPMSDEIENNCRTMGVGERTYRPTSHAQGNMTIELEPNAINKKQDFNYSPSPRGDYKFEAANGGVSQMIPIRAIIGRIGDFFGGKARSNSNAKYDEVYSSIFASSEVKRKSHMVVQVYLHLLEETEKVKALAQESDKNAERRDYIPLQCKLKKDDKVDVLLNIYGETLLMSDKKSVVWQGLFTKCSFDYFVPKDIDMDELSCVALLTVNGIPVGEMRFITKVVEFPRKLNPEIIAHKYNKVFISYSHQDESKVKFLHEGLMLGAVPHFFDRKYLKAGDVFPQVIQDYINSADLFILCWSGNAAKSEYVKKERIQALGRAFPQIRPEQEAKLRIYPLSIEPHAELPNDMKDNYHFEVI